MNLNEKLNEELQTLNEAQVLTEAPSLGSQSVQSLARGDVGTYGPDDRRWNTAYREAVLAKNNTYGGTYYRIKTSDGKYVNIEGQHSNADRGFWKTLGKGIVHGLTFGTYSMDRKLIQDSDYKEVTDTAQASLFQKADVKAVLQQLHNIKKGIKYSYEQVDISERDAASTADADVYLEAYLALIVSGAPNLAGVDETTLSQIHEVFPKVKAPVKSVCAATVVGQKVFGLIRDLIRSTAAGGADPVTLAPLAAEKNFRIVYNVFAKQYLKDTDIMASNPSFWIRALFNTTLYDTVDKTDTFMKLRTIQSNAIRAGSAIKNDRWKSIDNKTEASRVILCIPEEGTDNIIAFLRGDADATELNSKITLENVSDGTKVKFRSASEINAIAQQLQTSISSEADTDESLTYRFKYNNVDVSGNIKEEAGGVDSAELKFKLDTPIKFTVVAGEPKPLILTVGSVSSKDFLKDIIESTESNEFVTAIKGIIIDKKFKGKYVITILTMEVENNKIKFNTLTGKVEAAREDSGSGAGFTETDSGRSIIL